MASTTSTAPPPLTDEATIAAYESLNKWENCTSSDKKIPPRMVYQHNRTRAASKGFPSVLEVGKSRGLTEHEVAALFGWTTGDYRLLNPIVRGQTVVEFEDYPWLPQDLSKVTFQLSREEVLPYIQIVQEALAKLPVDGQRVWRGHRRPLPRDKGSQSVLEGFTSATLDRENALEFCVKSDVGKTSYNNRTLLCILEPKSGKSISKFSARPEELEVVFPPVCTVEVVEAPDGNEEDKKAIQKAMEQLKKTVTEATIELLYVREV